MQVMHFPDEPVTFSSVDKYSLDYFLRFCRANPDLRVERSAQGEIIVMPPAGGESSHRSLRVAGQLMNWTDEDGRGEAFDSSVMFVLPDGASLSPDAAWVSHKRLRALSPEQRKDFLATVPEFVVEVMSPSDRLAAAKRKMQNWIDNGVQLGWLIDGDRKTVSIYRPGQRVETRRDIDKLAASEPLSGLVLNLRPIWRGLA